MPHRPLAALLLLVTAAACAPSAPPAAGAPAPLGVASGNQIVIPAAQLAGGDFEWGVTLAPALQRAPMAPANGSLTPEDLGAQFPSGARPDGGLVHHAGRWYYVGGGLPPSGLVESILDGGAVVTIQGNTLVTPRRLHGTGLHRERLYVVGGTGAAGALASLEHAPLDRTTGTVGAFTQVAGALPAARTDFAFAIAGDFMYVIGGDDGTGTSLASILYAPIDPEGGVGPFTRATADLPAATAGARAAVFDGVIYVVGGRSVPATVYALTPAASGDVAMVNPRGPFGAGDRPGVAVAGGRLYVAGSSLSSAAIVGPGFLDAFTSSGAESFTPGAALAFGGGALVGVEGTSATRWAVLGGGGTGGYAQRGRWSALVELGRAAQVASIAVSGAAASGGQVSLGYRTAPDLQHFDPAVAPSAILDGAHVNSGTRAVSTAGDRRVSRAVELVLDLDDSSSPDASRVDALTLQLAPTRVAVGSAPATLPAGTCSAVTLQLRDDDGAPLAVSSLLLAHLTWTGSLTFSGDPSCTNLTDQVIFQASSHSTLVFVGGGTPGPASFTVTPDDVTILPSPEIAVTVVPGPAARAEFVTDPPAAGVVAGVPFSVPVRVLDAAGNLTAGGVAMGISSGPPDAVLLGTTAVSVDASGLGTATGLVLRRSGDYALSATTGNGQVGVSGTLAVAPAAPASLAFVAVPTDAEVGAPIAPPIEVEVLDAFGNRADSAATVTLSTSPAGAGLTGASAAAVAGLATFPSAAASATGVYRLVATAPGLPDASAPYDLSVHEPGSRNPPEQLAWVSHPAQVGAGACSPAFRVEALDGAGARVSLDPQDFVTVTLTSDAGATFYSDFGCTQAVATVRIGAAGIATFYARVAGAGLARIRAGATLSGLARVIVWDLEVGAASKAAAPKPLNGWSCATGGGGGGALALGGALLALGAGRRRRRAAVAGALLALGSARAAEAVRDPGKAKAPSTSTRASARTPAADVPLPPPPRGMQRVPTAPPAPVSSPAALSPAPVPAPAPARRSRDARPSVAVLDVQSTATGDRTDVAALTDVLASSIDAPGWFRVVASRDVTAVLAYERRRELLGCTADGACLAELAGALGVDHVVSMTLGRVGGDYVLSGRLVDSRRGAALARASVEASSGGLVEGTRTVAERLLDGWRATRPPSEQPLLVRSGGGSPGAFSLRVAVVGALAPQADADARRSVGGEVGLGWRFQRRWEATLGGIAAPSPGARLGVSGRLLDGPVSLALGVRGAAWPGAGAYGGGPVLELAIPLGRRFALVGSGAAEAYAGVAKRGSSALLGGIGFNVRL